MERVIYTARSAISSRKDPQEAISDKGSEKALNITRVATQALKKPSYEIDIQGFAEDLHPKEQKTGFKEFVGPNKEIVLLGEQFLRDINGSQDNFCFQRSSPKPLSYYSYYFNKVSLFDSKYAKLDFSGAQGEKQREIKGGEQAIAFLRALGLNGTEIAELSRSCHQGASSSPIELAVKMYPELMYAPLNDADKPTIAETGRPTTQLWKIWREKEETIFSQQTMFKMTDPEANLESPSSDEAIFVIGTTKVNMETGVGTISLSAPSKTIPSFDFS